MKVAVLYAAMPYYEMKLNKLLKVIENTLGELGVNLSLDIINLAFEQLNFCDGIKSHPIEMIIPRLEASDGIIIASTASLYAPCGLMQTFLEHLSGRENEPIFSGKCCLTAVCSNDGSEGYACEALARVISRFKGYDAGRLPVGAAYLDKIGEEHADEINGIIERQAEDFYRMVSRRRKFFIAGEAAPVVEPAGIPAAGEKQELVPELESGFVPLSVLLQNSGAEPEKEPGHEPDNPEPKKEPEPELEPRKIRTKEIYEKFNTASSKPEEEHINEIASLLEKKLEAEGISKTEETRPKVINRNGFLPEGSGCRDKTLALRTRFKPQQAIGVNSVFQLMISGDENFAVNIKIHNRECIFSDGIVDNSEIMILADSKAWLDVLCGRLTCQKAFMVGHVKVRGNFMLLSKLDQVFEFNIQ